MLSRRSFLTVPPALAAAALAYPRRAHAEPRVGAAFPGFTARGLDDRTHTQQDLMGRRVFVVAMTSVDAQTDMIHWLNNAEARLGRARGNIFALVALRLGFYAWDGIVRSEARRGTPQWRWPNVYLDRDGHLQNMIGLPNDQRVPWAYVVEANGIVSVATHAIASHPTAQQVWAQMAGP
ncbi:MAG: hypothetical protein WCJ30_24890 [Deltaproteobacteria bacterium]